MSSHGGGLVASMIALTTFQSGPHSVCWRSTYEMCPPRAVSQPRSSYSVPPEPPSCSTTAWWIVRPRIVQVFGQSPAGGVTQG